MHELSSAERLARQTEKPEQQERPERGGTKSTNDNGGHLVQEAHLNLPPDTHHGPGSTRATLESLPAELRLQILFDTADVADLRALAIASPIFRQQYMLDRRRLLQHALEKALGSVCADALAVMMFAHLREDGGELPEYQVQVSLNYCYEDSGKGCGTAVLQKCGAGDLEAIAGFYLDNIRPLMEYCPQAFLTQRDCSTPLEVGALTKTERTRFLRSLYRFQLFCELFGLKEASDDDVVNALTGADVLKTFFGTFEPWEAEEVVCIGRLITLKYDQVFDAVEQKDHEDLVLKGLDLFNRVLEDYDHNRHGKMRLSRPTMARAKGVSLVECITANTQCTKRLESRYGRDESDQAEYNRVSLRFLGDDEENPPLGWVTFWREEYSNMFGDHVPPALQDWGYVFWDRDRLTEIGGTDDIVRVRYAASYDDPRSIWWN